MGQVITKIENIELPSANRVCFFVLVSYFLVTAGVAYDIINEPPAVGADEDPKTGVVKGVTFAPGVSSQYIMEGFLGAFMYSLGGLGLIALEWAHNKKVEVVYRQYLQYGGIACVALSFLSAMTFLELKLPGYM